MNLRRHCKRPSKRYYIIAIISQEKQLKNYIAHLVLVVMFLTQLLIGLVVPVYTRNNFDKSLFPPLPVSVLQTDNVECKEQSYLYVANLENLTLWAYEMWDSTAKSPTGVLRGSVFQMGHFEQCITAEAPFRTQYCLAKLTASIPKPLQPRDHLSLFHPPQESVLQRLYPYRDVSQQVRNTVQMGWCVPASCSPNDLEHFLNGYINQLDLPLRSKNVTYTANLSETVCQTENDRVMFNNADIAFCILSFLILLMVVGATIYDVNLADSGGEKPLKQTISQRLFVSFSFCKSFKDLLKIDESNRALAALYGVRTFCILMIILDHRFGTFTASALLNFNYVETQYRAPFACFLFHGDLFVDAFFLLSGLLVAYGLLGHFEKKFINPCYIVFLRYIRLTPVYAFVIFYYATMFNYSGSGPLWRVIASQESQECKDNWWTNLLYINNYVNASHMCMVHAWYLPCDFHFFIIGTAVCLLIKNQKKAGLAVLLALTIVSIIIPFALTIIYERPALLHFYPEALTAPRIHPDFMLTYSKSHTRATPYFIGMFTGYTYYKLKGTNKHICRIKSYSLIFVSIFLILMAIVSGAAFYNPYHKYNAIEAATYAALHRPAFAIGLAGFLFVTSFGHAGVPYKILSWRPLVPLSKLVYGAYLVHMTFQLRAASKFMNPHYFSYFDTVSMALSDMVLAFVTAFVLFVGVEAPCRRIFRELLMPPAKEIAKKDNVDNTINNNQNLDSRL